MLNKSVRKIFLSYNISIYFLLSLDCSSARAIGYHDAKEYLSKYGWISSEAIPDKIAEARSIQGALRDFQSFFGLSVTGQLDNATVTVMQTPRCAVPDKFQDNNSIRDSRRTKRFVLHGSRWDKAQLTYKVTKHMTKRSTTTSTPSEVNQEIQKAFQMWEIHTNLNFVEATTDLDVDINIRFESGDHGDGFPFRDLTAAHAFYPAEGGDIHFNDEQDWTVDGSQEPDVRQLAAHEIGHSIGLDHSNATGSIMNSLITFNPKFQLQKDDILGIQAIYGVRPTVEPQPPSTTTPVPATPIPDTDQTCPTNEDYNYMIPFYVQMMGSSEDEFDIFNAPFEIQPITEIPWE